MRANIDDPICSAILKCISLGRQYQRLAVVRRQITQLKMAQKTINKRLKDQANVVAALKTKIKRRDT